MTLRCSSGYCWTGLYLGSTADQQGELYGPNAFEKIGAQSRRFARLDAMASNAVLCRYYEQRGFRPLVTATLFGGMYTARLFERALPQRTAPLSRGKKRRRTAQQDYRRESARIRISGDEKSGKSRDRYATTIAQSERRMAGIGRTVSVSLERDFGARARLWDQRLRRLLFRS